MYTNYSGRIKIEARFLGLRYATTVFGLSLVYSNSKHYALHTRRFDLILNIDTEP
jgi:hypothetical protein